MDILYNNASALRNGELMELTDEDWHFTVRNELDIVWFSVRAAWPELVRRGGGSIVNVASIAAKLGARFVGQVPHGSAKGGVLAMTEHLCAGRRRAPDQGERDPARPHLHAGRPPVHRRPGWPAARHPGQDPASQVRARGRGRQLAAFLASDDAAFITGAEIAIDGGDGSVAA